MADPNSIIANEIPINIAAKPGGDTCGGCNDVDDGTVAPEITVGNGIGSGGEVRMLIISE